MWQKCVLLLLVCSFSVEAQHKSSHFWEGRSTIVHLFEWKWKDIADECERFLQHRGYGGVQISPPQENLVVANRPWWERYQPVSYKLITRSGNEEEFTNMTKRCNAVGVRIFADVVINHMAAGNGVGTGGSMANASSRSFPAVPYGRDDFNAPCAIENFDNSSTSRVCELVGLPDLDQSKEHVRNKIATYMNHLIDLGVAGFRIDAARHMFPSDLKVIYAKLKDLNPNFGFQKGLKPFIYQEVGNMDRNYIGLAAMEEFKYGSSISNVFKGNDKLKWLVNWGPEWGLIDGLDAVPFVDNHDTQREKDALSFKRSKQYKMAVAFMLAHPYGTPRVMSSFDFADFDQGPPSDKSGNIQSPGINADNTCINGWICEHRWREIYHMVEFRNAVAGTGLNDFWSNGDQQISFCRGGKGFIAFTNWGDINQNLQTCLPEGVYCDVISGGLENGSCTGKSVTVGAGGKADVSLGALEFDGMVAIHIKSRRP